MKSAESKTTTATHPGQSQEQARQPFFQKKEEGAFFSTEAETLEPFFSSATIQPKLTIDHFDDPYEQEADAMAEQVVGASQQEKQNMENKSPGKSAMQERVFTHLSTPSIQRSRGSRIDVATSVQAFRTTYPDDTRGGLLTQELLRRLRSRRTTASSATSATGAGSRVFGSRPGSVEERAGISVGARATASPGTTPINRAVVIGNGIYNPNTTMGSTVEPSRPLPGSPRDARNVSSLLRQRGYSVNELNNQTAAQINSALTQALAGLPQGSELFFFYSGHGTIEGLIGVDGQAFTPNQMLAIRTSARTAQVNLVINTDACHAGIFADAIRGAELRDALGAATRTVASGTATTTASPLVGMLNAAIAVQSAKDSYNHVIQAWWARRYQLEAALSTPPLTETTDPRLVDWQNHYELGGGHWNHLVTEVNPLLATMRTAATTVGVRLRSLTLRPVPSPFNNTGEMIVQAGLDDIDTLTNEVLVAADSRI